ncbi:hypothetical protein JL721_99 [Aureococcus anophagefferens]|nr:hypothetical protein JL721_99 [Aureococcus anophagefferens]
MTTFTPTELFGGAMSAQLPASWQDMNDLGHPVPDNQEVWCERAGGEGGSLVIEIVERADVDDAAAPAYFWNDIADASGASARELTGVVGPDHGVDVAVAAFRFPAEATDVLATFHAPALGGTRLAPKPLDELLATPALAPLRDVLRTLVVDRGLFS